jgi:hypothetical protein
MKKELFDELIEAVKEGGAILRGEQAPGQKRADSQPQAGRHSP